MIHFSTTIIHEHFIKNIVSFESLGIHQC